VSKKPDDVVVVCARITTPLYMADNRTGTCCGCGWTVQFRPHAPEGRRMCMECAAVLVPSDAKITILPRMLDDLKAYVRKRLQ
jgi:hypothetical protein